jgi:hypothetical protein
MDADAMDASKCMPPPRFEDHQVNQHRDMVRFNILYSDLRLVFLIATLIIKESQSFTITDKLKLSNIGNRVFNAKVDLGVSGSSHSATIE